MGTVVNLTYILRSQLTTLESFSRQISCHYDVEHYIMLTIDTSDILTIACSTHTEKS